MTKIKLRNIKLRMAMVMLCITFGVFNVAGLGEIIYSVPSPADIPRGLEWDGQYLWVSDESTSLIYHFDQVNNVILREIRGPEGTKEVAWDGNDLWAITENRIYKLDPSNGNIILYFNKPFEGSPEGLAWDKKGFLWIGEMIYSSNPPYNKFNVHKVDPSTGHIVYSVTLENGFPDVIAGITWDGRHIWTINPVISSTYEQDINGRVISLFRTTGGNDGPIVDLRGLAFDGEFLWISGKECARPIYDCSISKIYKVQVFPEVKIDIVPDTINFRPRGSFPVVIFGSTSFDVTKIDVSTVTLSGAEVKRNPNGKLMSSFEDVNGDGFLDMTVQMNILGLQLPEGNTVGILMGDLQDETSFIGKDNVLIQISRQIR